MEEWVTDATLAFAPTEFGRTFRVWAIERLDSIFDAKLGKMLSQESRTGRSSRLYLRNANVQWGRVNIRGVYEMDFNEEERGSVFACYRATS